MEAIRWLNLLPWGTSQESLGGCLASYDEAGQEPRVSWALCIAVLPVEEGQWQRTGKEEEAHSKYAPPWEELPAVANSSDLATPHSPRGAPTDRPVLRADLQDTDTGPPGSTALEIYRNGCV